MKVKFKANFSGFNIGDEAELKKNGDVYSISKDNKQLDVTRWVFELFIGGVWEILKEDDDFGNEKVEPIKYLSNKIESFYLKHIKNILEDSNHKDEFGNEKVNTDLVNHPPHYKQGDVECIDAIKSALTKEEFEGYCKGNAMKYIWRSNHKGKKEEDLDKAIWYLKKNLDKVE